MTTEAQQRLADFYDRVIERACSGACRQWMMKTGEAPAGGALLRPRAYARANFLEAWPEAFGQPGFVLDRTAVEWAFTQILKLDSDVDITPGSDQTRKHLHVAEQHADARAISDGHVDLVVQIAVFGRVVFPL